MFVQDKWTMNRLTLSAGVRIDWFDSQNPAFHLDPSLLTPNRNYDVPEFSTTRYADWTPKVGVAYDLFGDGKTAIKANVGTYVLGQALVVGGLASQPGYNVQLTSSRNWTDNNKNFIPDCDLTRNPPTRVRRRPAPTTRSTPAALPVGAERQLLQQLAASRTSRCRTTPATAGASVRTAGSSRSARSAKSAAACRSTAASSGAGSATSW